MNKTQPRMVLLGLLCSVCALLGIAAFLGTLAFDGSIVDQSQHSRVYFVGFGLTALFLLLSIVFAIIIRIRRPELFSPSKKVVPNPYPEVISIFQFGHYMFMNQQFNLNRRTTTYNPRPITLRRPLVGTMTEEVICHICHAAIPIKIAGIKDCRKGQIKQLSIGVPIMIVVSLILPWLLIITIPVTLFTIVRLFIPVPQDYGIAIIASQSGSSHALLKLR